jgi:hypothetical protein
MLRSVSRRLRRLLRRAAEPAATLRLLSDETDPLTILANRCGSDKGDRHFGRHQYTRIYSNLFAPFRTLPIRFLEIGLLHPMDARPEGHAPRSHAPSLQMWASYFPTAAIIGFDLEDFSAVRLPRCQVIQGDMGSKDELLKLSPFGPFDIILEDASHASHHQQIALGALFPTLAPGGLYIIEDLHWQPAEIEIKGVPKTRDILRKAEVTGIVDSPLFSEDEYSYLNSNLAGIELHDSMDRYNPDRRDGLGVIRKRQKDDQ